MTTPFSFLLYKILLVQSEIITTITVETTKWCKDLLTFNSSFKKNVFPFPET